MYFSEKNLCVLVLLYFCVQMCKAISFLEFFVGPRLGRNSVKSKSLEVTPAQLLIERYGYPFECHEVTTDTGYILNLHRIPYGIKRRRSNVSKRPVALFQHGIFSASDMWLFRGPEHDLPYVLADAGYDVWLSNMRGNFYSKRHKTLNADKDANYWDFTLHEISMTDYPAIFDYILNKTNQEDIYFLGHSIGSTTGFIFTSLRPEYNKRIRLHLALAPLLYVNHSISLGHRLIFMPGVPLSEAAISHRIYNVFPRRKSFSKMLQMICTDEAPLQQVCLSLVMATVGADYSQLNTSYIPELVKYFPAGASVHVMQHTLQIYLKGNFAPYRYENETLNLLKYNQILPEPYNLSMVTHPVSLHYGSADILVTREDINETDQRLPNSVGKFQVPLENFNHMDFVWGADSRKLLYDKLIKIMDKYK